MQIQSGRERNPRELPIVEGKALPLELQLKPFKDDLDQGRMPDLERIKKLFQGIRVSSRKGERSHYNPPTDQNIRLESLEKDPDLLKALSAFDANRKKLDFSVGQLHAQEKNGLGKILEALIEFNSKAYAPISGSRYSSIFVYNIGTSNLKIFAGANVDVPVSKIRRCAEVNASDGAAPEDKLDLIFLYRDPRLDIKAKFNKKNLKELRPEQLLPCNHCATQYVTQDFLDRGGKVIIFNRKKQILDKATDKGYLAKELAQELKEPSVSTFNAGSNTYHIQVLGHHTLPAAQVEATPNANISRERATSIGVDAIGSNSVGNLVPIADLLKF